MKGFTNLNDENIRISNLDYVMRAPMKKKINLTQSSKMSFFCFQCYI